MFMSSPCFHVQPDGTRPFASACNLTPLTTPDGTIQLTCVPWRRRLVAATVCVTNRIIPVKPKNNFAWPHGTNRVRQKFGEPV